ncbi:hypothetical protein JZ751_011123 [Albula glossodonta]|uniref:Dapper n=1 Tax=Albula glossodonta TaxID=121402 RepID=A0A8T2NU17_9TELE|nr:hypothetical protein JZ751_011123 [Albula glossodonta]
MMSKKVSGSGLLNAAAGIDRGRVRERLRAALAGLQELHFLKEKQSNMVFWALRMDREEPLPSNQSSVENPELETEEQRLEATLTALKQQLSRLRRQDVGLKSHLQQLDQQISELKLDVSKVSSEHLETDSRPSSGFYDLSDGGSGSLSNSCTSVYSECLSSSQSSLLPTPCSHGLRPYHPPVPLEASRRRSADESATQGDCVRGAGVRLGSSWIRTGTTSADRARQRPVSTGDLDRMVTQVPGFYKPADGKKISLCHNQRLSTVDLKYQNNLVSHSGNEVYRYPSPLHAVALQSPIFSLSGESVPVPNSAGETAGTQGGSPSAHDSLHRNGYAEDRPVNYINKLLQRSQSKVSLQAEGGKDWAQPTMKSHPGASAVISGDEGVTCSLALSTQDHSLHQQQVEMLQACPLEPGGNPAVLHCSQGLVNAISPTSVPDLREEVPQPCHYTYPEAPQDTNPSHNSYREEEGRKSGHSRQSSGEPVKGAALVRKLSDSRQRPIWSSSKEEVRGAEGLPVHMAQPEFVHAQFVPAGSQRVKVRQADKKTRAVRLRRRSCEKPRGAKQQAPSETGREASISTGMRMDRDPKQAGGGRPSRRVGISTGEGSGRSCSESSLCSSSFPHHPSLLPPQLDLPLRPGKAHRPHAQDCPPADPGRKKQVARKWQSAAEISTKVKAAGAGPTPGQRVRSGQAQAAIRRAGMIRSVSARPRSGQWGGHPSLLHPSATSSYSSSYFTSYGSRYPPAPYPVHHSRYPPRSESEYSADCASLFHSTIAESSEGELSDFTTNRFGDSESSCDSQSASDSNSSLSLEEEDDEEGEDREGEGGLVWAEATLGPTAAGLPLHQSHPEPPTCRIKASRALKKKIRHFEPAALKVMTLV